MRPVLVVEDNETIREQIAIFLVQAGFSVEQAPDELTNKLKAIGVF